MGEKRLQKKAEEYIENLRYMKERKRIKKREGRKEKRGREKREVRTNQIENKRK